MTEQRRGGWLLYRCRNCGALFGDIHIPDITKALLEVVYDQNMGLSWVGLGGIRPLKEYCHVHCKYGDNSIADCIGVISDCGDYHHRPDYQDKTRD